MEDLKTITDDTAITDAGFQYRTTNCLLHAGISTVGELQLFTAKDLLALRAFGLGCISDVVSVLAIDGRTLAPVTKVRDETTERMWELHQNGYTLEMISLRFGMTREGVRQRLVQSGKRLLTIDERARIRFESKLTVARAYKDEVRRAFIHTGSRQATSEITEIPVDLISVIIDELRTEGFQPEIYQARRGGHGGKIYEHDELIHEIRRAASIMGEPLMRFYYSRDASKHGLPAVHTLMKHFGSWEQACEAADVGTNIGRGKRPNSFSEEDAIAALHACAEELGKVPSIGNYEKWWRENDGKPVRKKDGEGLPGQLTIRLLFGGWKEAQRRAFM
jgi:Homing endonuclease associated repeat/Bacterial RNA polymerase, alpha chain C terminal domain